MNKPIKFKYPFPTKEEPSSFGFVRKHDVHTGVYLYCDEGDFVYAMESGLVVNVEKFTGEWAGTPWWNNTESILIQGLSGVICYGEIEVSESVRNKGYVFEGEIIGKVIPVLKKDKGKNPMNMLHIELYEHGTKESVFWKLDEERPEELLDITDLLKQTI